MFACMYKDMRACITHVRLSVHRLMCLLWLLWTYCLSYHQTLLITLSDCHYWQEHSQLHNQMELPTDYCLRSVIVYMAECMHTTCLKHCKCGQVQSVFYNSTSTHILCAPQHYVSIILYLSVIQLCYKVNMSSLVITTVIRLCIRLVFSVLSSALLEPSGGSW